jgi:hypothetical protein
MASGYLTVYDDRKDLPNSVPLQFLAPGFVQKTTLSGSSAGVSTSNAIYGYCGIQLITTSTSLTGLRGMYLITAVGGGGQGGSLIAGFSAGGGGSGGSAATAVLQDPSTLSISIGPGGDSATSGVGGNTVVIDGNGNTIVAYGGTPGGQYVSFIAPGGLPNTGTSPVGYTLMGGAGYPGCWMNQAASQTTGGVMVSGHGGSSLIGQGAEGIYITSPAAPTAPLPAALGTGGVGAAGQSVNAVLNLGYPGQPGCVIIEKIG